MARPAEFDRQEALENAMMLFWSQGYTATSVQQLLDCMGISRSSLYAAFGTKRDLFVEVLHHFHEMSKELAQVMAEAQDPVRGIRDFFEMGFFRYSDQWISQGCLLVNTILEMDGVDNDLCAIAAGHVDEIENAFAEYFRRCSADGTLPKGHDPEALARFVMTLVKGMRVAVRQKAGEAYLRGIVETALLVVQNPDGSLHAFPPEEAAKRVAAMDPETRALYEGS